MEEEMEVRDEVPTADELRAAAAEARANPLFSAKSGDRVTVEHTVTTDPAGEPVSLTSKVIARETVTTDPAVTETTLPVLAKEHMQRVEQNGAIVAELVKAEEQNQTQSNPLKQNEYRIGDKSTLTPPPLKVTERDSKGRIVKSEGVRTIKPENKGGRKPVITPEVIEDLRQAYLMGATDEQAAEYVNIHRATLSRYKADHPEFCDEVEGWKTNPIMKAKVTVYNNLNDPRIAAWYLERKSKDEFSTRSEVTGKDGEDLPPIKIEYVRPTDQIRTSKDPLRSDSETGSSMEPVDGSSN